MNWTLYLFFFPPKGHRNPANIVSWLGGILAIISFLVFLVYGGIYLAYQENLRVLWLNGIAISIIAAACDFIDGRLAGKDGSDYGKSFDPICDKKQHICRIFAVVIDTVVNGIPLYTIVISAVAWDLLRRNENISFLRMRSLQVDSTQEVKAHWSGKLRTNACYIGSLCLHVAVYYQHTLAFCVIAGIIVFSNHFSEYFYFKKYGPAIEQKDGPFLHGRR